MIDANSWITPYLEKVFNDLDRNDPVVKAASYSLLRAERGSDRHLCMLLRPSYQITV